MKWIRLCLVMFLAPAILSAQTSGISVEVKIDQEQVLAGEDLIAAVRIVNLSGQPLLLGDTDDWLRFSIESRENYPAQSLSPVPVQGQFVLESALAATKRANLTPHFDFRQPGRYMVTATVKIPQLNLSASSQPTRFDVVAGAKLMEFEFGVPRPEGAPPGPPETRRYELQQAAFQGHMRLYFRLADASGQRGFRVFPIGTMVSFGPPQAQIDRRSNLHVLHQNGARTFNYCVITPDGELVVRQTHEFTSTRPTLRAWEDGRTFVGGGARRLSPSDIPQPASDMNPVPSNPQNAAP